MLVLSETCDTEFVFYRTTGTMLCWQKFSFYTHWKHQKLQDLLFIGFIEREHRLGISSIKLNQLPYLISLYLTLESSGKWQFAKKAEEKRADERKYCNKNPWSIEENAVANDYFKFHIQSGILTGKAMIEEARKRYKILEYRKWLVIRAKVNNIMKAKN